MHFTVFEMLQTFIKTFGQYISKIICFNEINKYPKSEIFKTKGKTKKI